jgi:hypothetical protein
VPELKLELGLANQYKTEEAKAAGRVKESSIDALQRFRKDVDNAKKV